MRAQQRNVCKSRETDLSEPMPLMGAELVLGSSIFRPNRAAQRAQADHAAHYIMKLPKTEQPATPWQAAAEVLMLIGEHGGDPMMAHIAMLKALQRHKPKAAPVPRRRRAKAYRIVR